MSNSKKIEVEYFALLAEEAGRGREVVTTSALTLKELFDELFERYRFSLSDKEVKVSLNNRLVSSWETEVSDGDHVLLLTPLAGG